MALTKVTTKGITDNAVDGDKLAPGSVTTAKIGPSAVESSEIGNGTVTADDLASTLDLSPKTVTLSGSTVSALKRPVQDNIALLGFKMAVNDGLTVFNLVDGVVDEFHDESGTDESEGSNDHYCATNDVYSNNTTASTGVAGFSTSAVTCSTTSTAQTAPDATQTSPYGSTIGTFTVPTGVTSVVGYVFGAGGGTRDSSGPTNCNAEGGAGGFSTGTLAVTGSQVLNVVTGYGGLPANDPNGRGMFLGGGGNETNCHSSGGGGLSGIFGPQMANAPDPGTAPNIMLIAGAGGGGGHNAGTPSVNYGGAAGGTQGNRGGEQTEHTSAGNRSGGGGSQTAGGQGASSPNGQGQTGSFLKGGNSVGTPSSYGAGSGGGGYFGGGAGGNGPGPIGAGGGGSSYIGHPQITSGSTTAGGNPGGGSGEHACEAGYGESGGIASPFYGTATPVVANVGDGGSSEATYQRGSPGYVIITYPSTTFAGPGGGSTTIISTAFTSNSVPTSSRIVVFEENVDTPTLNTDIIASISRDGGSTFTNATLTDSGYVTGSSGQRILTGQATISGQPSGQSMRWKLALANNTVKIHGVALQWS